MTHHYMLDTNVVSNVLRYPNGAAARQFRAFDKGSLCISVIVAMELRFGAEKLGSQRLAEQIAIAAHALTLDLTLVTDNILEFSRVPDLRVENCSIDLTRDAA